MSLLDERDRLKARRGLNERLPLHGRLSSKVYHQSLRSRAPQAVVKVISFGHSAHRAKAQVMYVGRVGKDGQELELEDQDSRLHKGKAEVEALMREWGQDFERKQYGSKGAPRHTTHIMLSALARNDHLSTAKVIAAAREFLQKQFGELGYEYVFVMHRDTEHPHVHVVVKNQNRELGNKLRLGPKELFHLRTEFANELKEQGIEHVATLRRDRHQVLEKVASGIERLKQGEKWYRRKLETAPEAAVDALALRRSQARTLAYLKADVKAQTFPFSTQRRAFNVALRELSHALLDRSPEAFRQEVAQTIAKFGKDGEFLRDGLDQLHNARISPTASKGARGAQLEQRHAVLEKFAQKYQRDLDLAKQEIKGAKQLSFEERREMFGALNGQEQVLSKLERDRGRGR